MKDIKPPQNIIDFTDYVSAKYYLIHKEKEEVLEILNTTEKIFKENDYFYQTLLYNDFMIDIKLMEDKTPEDVYNFAKKFISWEILKVNFDPIIDINKYKRYSDYFKAIKNSILLNPAFKTFKKYFEKNNTFVFIDCVDEIIYRDDKYLYYGFEIVRDKKKNIIVPDNLHNFNWIRGVFFSDGEFLYSFYGKSYYFDYLAKIKKCDLETFEVVGEYYGKDNERIFYTTGKSLLSKSSNELTILEDDWFSYTAKDKDYVYYKGIKLKEAHAPTYNYVGQGFYKDNKNLWHYNKIVQGNFTIDTESFVPIYNPWGTDKNYVYVYDRQEKPTDYHRKCFKDFFESNKEKYKDYWYFKN